MRRIFLLLYALALNTTAIAQGLHSETLPVGPGKTITLKLRDGFGMSVAATGIKRVRFFAKSPDGRVFATSLYNLSDNRRGAIYILDGWDATKHAFAKVTPYLTGLRNPNTIAFYTDERGASWIYVALTDRLRRFPYQAGAMKPGGPAETLMQFPDYGLSYKYGGWHLTRSIAIARLHGRTRVYVAAGSSCNYCREREAQRAAVVSMNPDGTQPEIVASGIRNAVDLRFVDGLDGGALFATNMGDDHLGDGAPEDTFFELDSNAHPGPIASAPHAVPNYGWPTCYFSEGKPVLDSTPLPDGPSSADAAHVEASAGSRSTDADSAYGKQERVAGAGTNLAAQVRGSKGLPQLGAAPAPLTRCDGVPAAYTTFRAHSSPLGLMFLQNAESGLQGSFLVALHGSGHTRVGAGYKVVQFNAVDRKQADFLTGFLTAEPGGTTTKIHGRPCGMLQVASNVFLVSDDYLGVVYAVWKK